MTQEDMEAWRRAEQAAVDAETALERLGQGAADPRVGELVAKAKELRQVADDILVGMLRKDGIPDGIPPAPGEGNQP